jgi:hypothetical protein
MKASGFVRLASYYFGTFGPLGAVLLADRVARRALPTGIYRRFWGQDSWDNDDVPQNVIPHDLDPDAFHARFPNAVRRIMAAADEAMEHRFDFLGTGPTDWGDPIRWHEDPNSGHLWPVDFYSIMTPINAGGTGADVKIPWELSRFHHGVVLAQAYYLSGENCYADALVEQWRSWRQANPYPYGINWTSAMDVAIRAVNVLYAAALVSSRPGDGQHRLDELSKSMRQHGSFIERNLEIGVGEIGVGEIGTGPNGLVTGNHYLANLSGLACIGLALPGLPEAGRWARVGLSGLSNEAKRQVLADGLSWEGSTSYHRLVLELLLVPALIARRAGVNPDTGKQTAYFETLELMCAAVMHLTGPDGTVPLIGDNDDGRMLVTDGGPDRPVGDHRYLLGLGAALFFRSDMKAAAGKAQPDLFWLLGEQGLQAFDALDSEPNAEREKAHAFESGGLCVLRGDGVGDFALLRTRGAVPGAPTGHLHNDALSLVLWIGGEAVTVDPGTLAYTSDTAARDELRSTLAHATVSLDGREQNRPVPGNLFALGIETEVELVECRSDDSVSVVTGRARWHGGGTHIRSVVHDRRTGEWRVEDTVTGAGTATWNWPLAPGRETLGASVEADFPLTESIQEARIAPSYGVPMPIRRFRHVGTLNGQGRAVFTFQASSKSANKAAERSGAVAGE